MPRLTELLAGILRGEWGFDGLVASDYMGVEMVALAHHLTPTSARRGRLRARRRRRCRAAADRGLRRAARRGARCGRVDEAQLDATVGRVLRMKFRLGLFDRPYVDVPADSAIEALVADEARAGRTLAERSLVLVENDGILPFAPGVGRVAVIGPIAESARDLLGDYSHLVHMQTLSNMRSGVDALGGVGGWRHHRAR